MGTHPLLPRFGLCLADKGFQIPGFFGFPSIREVSNGSMQTCYHAYGCGWIRTMCFLTPYSYVVGFGCITHLQEPTKVKAAEMKCSKHSMVQIK